MFQSVISLYVELHDKQSSVPRLNRAGSDWSDRTPPTDGYSLIKQLKRWSETADRCSLWLFLLSETGERAIHLVSVWQHSCCHHQATAVFIQVKHGGSPQCTLLQQTFCSAGIDKELSNKAFTKVLNWNLKNSLVWNWHKKKWHFLLSFGSFFSHVFVSLKTLNLFVTVTSIQ